MGNEEYFRPGEVVKVYHKIEHAPNMVVKTVDKVKDTKGGLLLGITCFWFTDLKIYQEQRFNTKDLIKC